MVNHELTFCEHKSVMYYAKMVAFKLCTLWRKPLKILQTDKCRFWFIFLGWRQASKNLMNSSLCNNKKWFTWVITKSEFARECWYTIKASQCHFWLKIYTWQSNEVHSYSDSITHFQRSASHWWALLALTQYKLTSTVKHKCRSDNFMNYLMNSMLGHYAHTTLHNSHRIV